MGLLLLYVCLGLQQQEMQSESVARKGSTVAEAFCTLLLGMICSSGEQNRQMLPASNKARGLEACNGLNLLLDVFWCVVHEGPYVIEFL